MEGTLRTLSNHDAVAQSGVVTVRVAQLLLRPHRLRPQLKHALAEDGHLDPVVFLLALLIFVGIPALTVIKVARLRAARPQSLSADAIARLEALERGVQDLQKELAETHERLDFTERLLTKAREER